MLLLASREYSLKMLPILSCYGVIYLRESFEKPGMSTVWRQLLSDAEEGARWSQMHERS